MITFSNLEKMGRLGNQLFQLMAAISLAEKNDDSFIFPKWKYEKYFNLKDCFCDNIKPTKIYKENKFSYEEINISSKNEIYDIVGYFQSWKYFDNYKHFLIGLFTPNISIERNEYTSLHVRRGDYVSLGNYYNQLTLENYYNKAMSIVNSDKYIIVSDDIDWCKKIFAGNKFIFSESKDEINDLALMISCKNNIIANSSFSWMGAYLNPNPEKIVVAPNNWFAKNSEHNTKDLLPNDWIKV